MAHEQTNIGQTIAGKNLIFISLSLVFLTYVCGVCVCDNHAGSDRERSSLFPSSFHFLLTPKSVAVARINYIIVYKNERKKEKRVAVCKSLSVCHFRQSCAPLKWCKCFPTTNTHTSTQTHAHTDIHRCGGFDVRKRRNSNNLSSTLHLLGSKNAILSSSVS